MENKQPNAMSATASLFAKVQHPDGRQEDLGKIAERLVTTVGVNAIVDAFQGTVALQNFKYHITGTDVAAEATTDTEATITGATPDPVAGSQGEGASANIYRTSATISYVSSLAITSHGIIDNAVKTGSRLLDRSVFAAINVINGTQLTFAYELTINAGG